MARTQRKECSPCCVVSRFWPSLFVTNRERSSTGRADEPSGKTPEEALKSIVVAPGFKVELMAGEPLVKDPIAFDWGADGKVGWLRWATIPRESTARANPEASFDSWKTERRRPI